MRVALLLTLYVACQASFATPATPSDGCKNADSGSYTDIALCGMSKFEKSDVKLNQTYNELLKALKDDRPRHKLVVESQRAWLVYRDKSCKYWADLLSYHVTWCKFDITERRVEELKHMHACLVEGGSAC